MSVVNVGVRGGDLAARRFAILVTLGLTVLALPPLGVSDSALRLAAVAVAMSGTLLLMAGLVFLQKTHYAGIMLIPAAGGMLALAQSGHRFGAVVVGFLFFVVMAFNLVTRRCLLNRLLGIQSCS
jgi:hypothetical protein